MKFVKFACDYLMGTAQIVFGRKSLREFIRQVNMPAPIQAAEIGTWAGVNAAVILRKLRPSLLICVDPYLAYMQVSSVTMHKVEQAAHRRLSGKPVRWVRSIDRVEAARLIGQVDYLYIDAAHDYENVRADIEAYWPCVKPGGMMAGHDICWPSVFKAVSEFAVRTGAPTCAYDTDFWIFVGLETQGVMTMPPPTPTASYFCPLHGGVGADHARL